MKADDMDQDRDGQSVHVNREGDNATGGDDKALHKYSAPALSKGLDILEYLSAEPEAQKKADIARALDRSISEIFRMLAVLEQREYVAFDSKSERYSLTTKMFELAHRYPPIRRLSVVAVEPMQALARDTNQSVHLAIRRDLDILVIAQVDSPGDNVISVRLGARIPLLKTASGAVLAANLSSDLKAELDDMLAKGSPKQAKTYQQNCEFFKDQGYCESASMVVEGVTNISVPIADHSGEVIAALTIPFVTRLSSQETPSRAQAREALIGVGREISRMLGGDKLL